MTKLMHLFYSQYLDQDIIEMSQEESKHCSKVLRLRPGDEVGFIDGKGTFCKAHLLQVDQRIVTASVFSRKKDYGKRPIHLHIAIAPTKNIDRFEWFLEKATECGIDEITPIICAQSERTIVKPDRLHRVLLAATKQSQRAYLPVLNENIKFKDFVTKIRIESSAYIAHCDDTERIPLHKAYSPGNNVLILIGPEGDFSPAEIMMAREKGIQAISLGANRLRTETAALVACMAVNFMNEML